ncbi:MAG TPA: S-adenosylmethionine:tRNA ribosyltransferase-isomerase, partial [Acidimicrobiales bacterium]
MAPTTIERTSASRAVGAARSPFADLDLQDRHIAVEPPEARGVPRDGVRLLVSSTQSGHTHTVFRDVVDVLRPGDVLVVNTSGTRPAAVDVRTDPGADLVLHVSTSLPGG